MEYGKSYKGKVTLNFGKVAKKVLIWQVSEQTVDILLLFERKKVSSGRKKKPMNREDTGVRAN